MGCKRFARIPAAEAPAGTGGRPVIAKGRTGMLGAMPNDLSLVPTITALTTLDGSGIFQVRILDKDLSDDPGPWLLVFPAAAPSHVPSILEGMNVEWLRPGVDPTGPWVVDRAALAAEFGLEPPSWMVGKQSVRPDFDGGEGGRTVKFIVSADDAIDRPTAAQLSALPNGWYFALVETGREYRMPVRMRLQKTPTGFVGVGGGGLAESDEIASIRPHATQGQGPAG